MAAVLLYVCSAFVVWVELLPKSGAVLICPTSCTCLGGLIDCSKKGLLSVPADLRHCSWVTRLELQSNGITALGPTDFKGLHQLEVLFLNHNDIAFINGSIFGDLASLHTLKITHNKLTKMPVFPQHLPIKELSLANNLIHTITQEALRALPHLQVLYLNHNQIMDIPIGAFPSPSHLTHLYLSNNQIMLLEPGCLDNLTSLELLKLNKNQMVELRKDIFSSLHSLRLLELSRNKISAIQGLTFKGLKNLQVLKLKRNAIVTLMDGAFWGLESINTLQLDYNNIANITSSWLFGLSSLKQLSLTFNKIGDIQEDGWECCKQNLNTLDLTHNQLSTVYTNTFGKLTHLENLLLDHNRLSRIDHGAFDALTDLITLELNGNAIAWTMEDMTGAFLGLQNLVKLGLKMNHIKSITNHAFTGLRRLQQLHLEDNNITSIQHNSFQPLVNLRDLRLNSTNLLCDCHLGWLAGWLKSYGFHTAIIAVCSYPQALRGKSIFDVPPQGFKCNDLEIAKPVILGSPQSQNAYKGQNMTLTCTAAITGEVEPTIQWKKDNVVLPHSVVDTVVVSEGEVKHYTSSLHLYNIQDDLAGLYQCVVSNKFGSSFSQKATVNVYVFPVFLKKPVDVTVKAGQSAKLQCSASGQPQPVISWQKDGGHDFPAARERRMYVIPKDDQFFIARTRSMDEGVYTCRAQNEAGVVTANATVTILEIPDFISPMEEDKTARVGETAVLECMASGSPRPKLHWLKESQPLQVTPRHFFTADGQLLIIVETTWEDAGLYTCEMANTLGVMRGNTHLHILTSDGQRKSRQGAKGLDDESTTTGIIVIAVVCCVVGTSLVWVIIIYQTRKRHAMYSATPTEETTLPGELPSGYCVTDPKGSYAPLALTGLSAYHYQDYQMKQSGDESSSLAPHPVPWPCLPPPAAIFPSQAEEDSMQEPLLSHRQQGLPLPPSTPSLPSLLPSGEESESAPSCPSCYDTGGEEVWSVPNPATCVGMARGTSTLSTFHPWPTNHNRCPPITLPSVCGETTNHGRCPPITLPSVCGETTNHPSVCGETTSHDRCPSITLPSVCEEMTNHPSVCGETTNHDRCPSITQPSVCGETTNHDRCPSITQPSVYEEMTNHDRCPSITQPSVCRETETERCSPPTVTATTQTPCPNCRCCDEVGWEEERPQRESEGGRGREDRCAGCVLHRQCSMDKGCNSDTKAYQRPLLPVVLASGPSVCCVPSERRPLRPVQGGGGSGCCRHAVPHSKGRHPPPGPQQHCRDLQEGCVEEGSSCDDQEASSTTRSPSHHTCRHPLKDGGQGQSDPPMVYLPAKDTRCCAQCNTADSFVCAPPFPSTHHSQPTNHSHALQDSTTADSQHQKKLLSINV